MAVSEKELEDQLMEAGNRLLSPPSSVEDLLPLLDELQYCLERVEQSPSKRMLDALSPSINALAANTLLRHLDPDVQVSVATCISEITRITAPDAPYDDDDQMKEILKLIVSSFEKLYDKTNRSYNKRASVLETVAKVRSCLLMLDLECDTLIIEMFQHFLKSIRDYHSEDVFQSMETIMTLVLEESEAISPELLSSILFYLKKNIEDVQPIAQKLAKQVLVKCATKVKPYLLQALKLLKISLNDYEEVVANVCQYSPVELNSLSTQEVKVTLEESDDGSKIPSNGDKKVDVQPPSSKTSRRKTMNVSSPSPSGQKPEEIGSPKDGRGKKKESTILENTPDYVTSKKEDERRSVTSSVPDAKSSKQSNQKEGLVGIKQGDKRRSGKGKSFLGKDLTKTSSEDKAKEYGSPPKSAAKSVNNKSPAMSSKKKRTASGEKTKEYGENFVGSKIRVWWPDDQMFYEGRVDSFDCVKKKYKITYVDGDVERLDLKKEKWELIKGDADSDKGNANAGGDLDASPERHAKMAKTDADSVKNEDKCEQHKAKATAVKRGRKKRSETKEEDDNPKNTDLVDEVVKSEESNEGAVETALGGTEKTKQETSNISKKSKGKTSKDGRGGSKSNSNGSSVKGKVRKNSSPESAKSGETGKTKSPSINMSSKAQKSEGKSGKKRQRGS